MEGLASSLRRRFPLDAMAASMRRRKRWQEGEGSEDEESDGERNGAVEKRIVDSVRALRPRVLPASVRDDGGVNVRDAIGFAPGGGVTGAYALEGASQTRSLSRGRLVEGEGDRARGDGARRRSPSVGRAEVEGERERERRVGRSRERERFDAQGRRRSLSLSPERVSGGERPRDDGARRRSFSRGPDVNEELRSPDRWKPPTSPSRGMPLDSPNLGRPVDSPLQRRPFDSPVQGRPVGSPVQRSPVQGRPDRSPSQRRPFDSPSHVPPLNSPSRGMPFDSEGEGARDVAEDFSLGNSTRGRAPESMAGRVRDMEAGEGAALRGGSGIRRSVDLDRERTRDWDRTEGARLRSLSRGRVPETEGERERSTRRDMTPGVGSRRRSLSRGRSVVSSHRTSSKASGSRRSKASSGSSGSRRRRFGAKDEEFHEVLRPSQSDWSSMLPELETQAPFPELRLPADAPCITSVSTESFTVTERHYSGREGAWLTFRSEDRYFQVCGGSGKVTLEDEYANPLLKLVPKEMMANSICRDIRIVAQNKYGEALVTIVMPAVSDLPSRREEAAAKHAAKLAARHNGSPPPFASSLPTPDTFMSASNASSYHQQPVGASDSSFTNLHQPQAQPQAQGQQYQGTSTPVDIDYDYWLRIQRYNAPGLNPAYSRPPPPRPMSAPQHQQPPPARQYDTRFEAAPTGAASGQQIPVGAQYASDRFAGSSISPYQQIYSTPMGAASWGPCGPKPSRRVIAEVYIGDCGYDLRRQQRETRATAFRLESSVDGSRESFVASSGREMAVISYSTTGGEVPVGVHGATYNLLVHAGADFSLIAATMAARIWITVETKKLSMNS